MTEMNPRFVILREEFGVNAENILAYLVSPESQGKNETSSMMIDLLAHKICRSILFETGIMTIPYLHDMQPYRWAATVRIFK